MNTGTDILDEAQTIQTQAQTLWTEAQTLWTEAQTLWTEAQTLWTEAQTLWTEAHLTLRLASAVEEEHIIPTHNNVQQHSEHTTLHLLWKNTNTL